MTDNQHLTNAERWMAKARAQVELDQIRQDAVDGDLISFSGKAQFRIRDILLLTTFTAIILALTPYFGKRAIFAGVLLSIFAWGLYYAACHRRAHDEEIARRMRELSKKHGKDIVAELPTQIVTERVRE